MWLQLCCLKKKIRGESAINAGASIGSSNEVFHLAVFIFRMSCKKEEKFLISRFTYEWITIFLSTFKQSSFPHWKREHSNERHNVSLCDTDCHVSVSGNNELWRFKIFNKGSFLALERLDKTVQTFWLTELTAQFIDVESLTQAESMGKHFPELCSYRSVYCLDMTFQMINCVVKQIVYGTLNAGSAW